MFSWFKTNSKWYFVRHLKKNKIFFSICIVFRRRRAFWWIFRNNSSTFRNENFHCKIFFYRHCDSKLTQNWHFIFNLIQNWFEIDIAFSIWFKIDSKLTSFFFMISSWHRIFFDDSKSIQNWICALIIAQNVKIASLKFD